MDTPQYLELLGEWVGNFRGITQFDLADLRRSLIYS